MSPRAGSGNGVKALVSAARAARRKSYSPYSGHAVGAAIRLTDGSVFRGCNIENSSYGGTVCAERVAIWSAVAAKGSGIRVAEVAVVTDAEPAWPPCGMCRQVLSEFAVPGTVVHAASLSGAPRTSSFSRLLPEAFTPDFLTTGKSRKTRSGGRSRS